MANKKRRCRQCKKYVEVTRGFVSPGNAFFCDTECAFQYAYPIGKKTVEKKERQRLRARKAELKPITKRKNELQVLVNQYVRLRDQHQACISCGLPAPKNDEHQRHASHFISRGHSSFLRYNTLNIHASCATCNGHKSGNITEYRKGLVEKYGEALVERLENSPTIRKYDQEYIEKAKRIFKKKIKQLNKRNALHHK